MIFLFEQNSSLNTMGPWGINNVPCTHPFFMDPTSVPVTTHSHNNSRRKRQRIASFLADYSRLWATDQDQDQFADSGTRVVE